MQRFNLKVNSDVVLDKANTRTIIEATNSPKSVREISAECGIPLSTVYRRVYELCDCNLLEVHSSAIKEGKRRLLFKTKEQMARSK